MLVTPKGHQAGAIDVARKTLRKLEESLATVASISDKQAAHSLLRVCVGANRLAFLLRVLDTEATQSLWGEADALLQQAWGRVVGAPLTDAAWLQSTLPVSQGGCGIIAVTKLGPVARLASILQFIKHGLGIAGADDGLCVRVRCHKGTLSAAAAILPRHLSSSKHG